jgi:hypothetical protein
VGVTFATNILVLGRELSSSLALWH